ncbi:hypothetical protein E5288_WYG020116 [Bos mutus]|uniref:Uncharacterized protein n=1 Tax=Bos mutus TaxID=72004 RepID=A0A6B0SDC3_9CETA|nr:hypothetical protein [Bos mutus]
MVIPLRCFLDRHLLECCCFFTGWRTAKVPPPEAGLVNLRLRSFLRKRKSGAQRECRALLGSYSAAFAVKELSSPKEDISKGELCHLMTLEKNETYGIKDFDLKEICENMQESEIALYLLLLIPFAPKFSGVATE